jgi:formylglycine-generating enzyme required for sulfatase activity
MYSGSDSIGDVAWYRGNSGGNSPKPVGGKLPNALGIYDMTGNIAEMCGDSYTQYYGSTREELENTTEEFPIDNPYYVEDENKRSPARGGAWIVSDNETQFLRNACRVGIDKDSPLIIGIRLVLPY